MKKFLLFIPLLMLFIATPVLSASKQVVSEKTATLPSDEVIDGNYYAFGETVEIFGTVNGDVYAGGGQVLVDGTINGDLIAAGGIVNVSGKIGGNARLGGGQVIINAQIGRNLSVGGGNVDISDTASIGQALQVGAGNIALKGPVGAEALIAAGNATISSTINENLQAKVGNLRLTPQAKITGNLDYWAEESSIDDSATVSGTVTKHDLPKKVSAPSEKTTQDFLKGLNYFTKLTSLINTLIIGFILIKLFPNCTKKTVLTIRERFWASLGLGFIALIIAPVILILLMITIIGLPLAFALAFLFALYLFIARLYLILALGAKLPELLKKSKVGLTMSLFIGLLAYYALTLIPFISGITKIITILTGLGASILSSKSTYHSARENKVF